MAERLTDMTEPIVSIATINHRALEDARAAHNTTYRTSCPYPLGSAAAEVYAAEFNAARERIAVVQQAQTCTQPSIHATEVA
jgi:hypothetical protein